MLEIHVNIQKVVKNFDFPHGTNILSKFFPCIVDLAERTSLSAYIMS